MRCMGLKFLSRTSCLWLSATPSSHDIHPHMSRYLETYAYGKTSDCYQCCSVPSQACHELLSPFLKLSRFSLVTLLMQAAADSKGHCGLTRGQAMGVLVLHISAHRNHLQIFQDQGTESLTNLMNTNFHCTAAV